MARKYRRIVGQIEKCFKTLHDERELDELSITHIKGWIDDNTKGGMSKMRLANFLNKRPQFHLIRRERRVGTTETESFWSLESLRPEMPNKTVPRKGWRIEIPKKSRIRS